MQVSEKSLDVLNDLVKINNDRIEGYDRAISESKDLDVDMKAVFEKMKQQSQDNKTKLVEQIGRLGGDTDDDTTLSGKIYRAWMDVKATFSGNDRKAVLESCEFGEDAAQRAYESALAEDDVDADIKNLIGEQQRSLKESHDLIKKYRDAH